MYFVHLKTQPSFEEKAESTGGVLYNHFNEALAHSIQLFLHFLFPIFKPVMQALEN